MCRVTLLFTLGTGHYLCGGEFFSFSVKEKTWPTPLTPLVNSWPTPIWQYIRGDPPPPFNLYLLFTGENQHIVWTSVLLYVHFLNQGLFAMDAFAVIENTIERVLDNDDI